MRHWPDTLPLPMGPGYELTPADPFLRTDMETGAARNRRLTQARRDLVQWVCRMSNPEFVAFRAWFEDLDWSLAGHSDDLAHWTGQNASWQAGEALTPSGVLVGRLLETAATGAHYLGPSLPGAANGATVRMTVSIRAAGRTGARVGVLGRDAVLRRLNIDLTDGAVSAVSGVQSWTVTERGNGWWRLSLLVEVGSGGQVAQARVYTLDGATADFAGNPLLGLDVAECNVRVPDGFDLYLPTDSGGRARGAGAGGAWSVIPLWTGGNYAPVEARFTGMFSVRVLPGLHAEVSAPVEVRHA